jgi:hypothetical protein
MSIPKDLGEVRRKCHSRSDLTEKSGFFNLFRACFQGHSRIPT